MSTFKSVLPYILVACLLVACSSKYTAPVSDRSKLTRQKHSSAAYHRVKKGETLYSISWVVGIDYKKLAAWNYIKKPYRIYPGAKLRIKPPVRANKRTSKKYTNKKNDKKTVRKISSKEKVYRKSTSQKKSTGQKSSSYRGSNKIGKWVWPASGKILRKYSSSGPGKKGITIGGRPGQPVMAAASGKVVYSGSGLVRYGKLIIIKHNNAYLSAYAHNNNIRVREGAMVKAGQRIADMGSTGANQTILHFEIRKNGKPVNPLRFLPKL